jgi:hypothetical protein
MHRISMHTACIPPPFSYIHGKYLQNKQRAHEVSSDVPALVEQQIWVEEEE